MTKEQPQIPRRPYLLRALHEWMTDSGQTPHIVVDAAIEGVVVPRQYVKDGKIILNVGYSATAGLVLKNDGISFSARFGGVAFDVSLPVHAVLGIYARETGQGMVFSDEEPASTTATVTESKPPKPAGGGKPSRRPTLKVVK
jgi:stringent starvation protein B